jgi:hypothetical protein
MSTNMGMVELAFEQLPLFGFRSRLASIFRRGYGAPGVYALLLDLRTYVFYPNRKRKWRAEAMKVHGGGEQVSGTAESGSRGSEQR